MLDQLRRAISGRTQARSYAALLGIGYLLFYGWLLVKSGGFPYVFDNNESFSSLWHAINLQRFGLDSFGLTDEAFSPSPAAHPYVYTHQGNFPRLVAFAFYAMGTRSIEAQIVVTTFTVGLVAVLFAYRFLGQLTSNWSFASLASAIMFSDYILVAQWQMVTYRVWHAFFFFATLLCVHAIEGPRPLRATLLLLVNTTCLFYFEFVFAAFVASCAGLYALFRNSRRYGRLALTGAALASGAAIGIGVLCTQIVLQFGWDTFVQDVTYTFFSRNSGVDSAALVKTLRAFYDTNQIVFWYNLFDATGFRNPLHLGASILYYELQPHTPYFVLLMLLPAVGYFSAHLRGSFVTSMVARVSGGGARLVVVVFQWVRRLVDLAVVLVLPSLLVGAHLFHRASQGSFGAVQAAGLVLALPIIVLSIMRARGTTIDTAIAFGSAALLFGTLPSVLQYSHWVWTQVGYLTWPVKAFAGGYVVLLLWNFHLGTIHSGPIDWGTTRPHERTSVISRRRIFEISLFAATSLALAVVLIGSPFALGWRPLGGWLLSTDIALGAVATLLVFIAIARLSGTREPDWRGWFIPGTAGFEAIDRAWRFNIVLIGIFVAQSMIFNQVYQPIWQALGEEVLAEPALRALMMLSVLLAHVLLRFGKAKAGGVSGDDGLLPKVGAFLLAGYLAYIIVYMLTPGYVFTGYRFRLAPFTVFLTDVVIACGIWLVIRSVMQIATRLRLHTGWGIAVGSLPLLFWAQLQFAQFSLMPPDQFAVFKSLANPPYRGASFVSNNYGGPVAAFTGQWAYIDELIGKAKIEERDGVKRLMTDDRYLWFADRATNKEYARPRYFICIIPQSLPSLAAKLLHERGDGEAYSGCADMGLVRFAKLNRKDVLPRAELVAIDGEGRRKYGHETWAIVKLDWGP